MSVNSGPHFDQGPVGDSRRARVDRPAAQHVRPGEMTTLPPTQWWGDTTPPPRPRHVISRSLCAHHLDRRVAMTDSSVLRCAVCVPQLGNKTANTTLEAGVG